MFTVQSFKKPIVLMPMLVGVVAPCLVFLVLHFSQPRASHALDLKDAVYVSGKPLPNTNLVQLDGNSLSPETLRKGKVLLIFLTTDCAACKKELTLLSQVESTLGQRVRVFGVGVQDRNQISNFLNANEFKTKFLLDKDGLLMTSLQVKYFPTRFLVEDGVITKTTFGNSRSQEDLFRELGL